MREEGRMKPLSSRGKSNLSKDKENGKSSCKDSTKPYFTEHLGRGGSWRRREEDN